VAWNGLIMLFVLTYRIVLTDRSYLSKVQTVLHSDRDEFASPPAEVDLVPASWRSIRSHVDRSFIGIRAILPWIESSRCPSIREIRIELPSIKR
jgi:hypothetical protein